jgi:hypothetical protein
VVYR